MTFVKVCGLTRIEDARSAWELGASALGLVFHPESPRRVSLETARRLRSALPESVVWVGVFVDAPRDHVQRVMETLRLGALQFHGREAPEWCEGWPVPVIKAIQPSEARDEARWKAYVHVAWAILLDADDPHRRGGTGRPTDWVLAARLAAQTRLILAGGLHAGLVPQALRQVRPFGLDLSSSLEREPGIKDPVKLQTLFQTLDSHGVRSCSPL